jgi:hypothetical protein
MLKFPPARLMICEILHQYIVPQSKADRSVRPTVLPTITTSSGEVWMLSRHSFYWRFLFVMYCMV